MDETAYSLIVVSPHLDDAALSCGGEVAARVARGERVLCLTVFSGGEGPAVSAGKGFEAFADMASRRGEDERAMARLGCEHRWLGFDEAVARDRRYTSPLRLISRPLPADAPLAARLTDLLRAAADRSPAAELFFPLGVGGHVDHRILFEVSRALDPRRVRYYEEIPYAFIPLALELRLRSIGAAASTPLPDSTAALSSRELARRAAEGILSVPAISAGIAAWQIPVLRALVALVVARHRAFPRRVAAAELTARAELVDVSAQADTKLSAVEEYRSQMPVLFASSDACRASMFDYARRVGGAPGQLLERRWSLASRT